MGLDPRVREGGVLSSPSKVIVAGDWHSNARWAISAVEKMRKALPEASPMIILHMGDLGIWREPETYEWAGKVYKTRRFTDQLEQALEAHDAELWFVDGNHENHEYLAEFDDADGWLTPRIRHLARGERWEWFGRTWLALGGAASVDRYLRTEGLDWFEGERITREQADAVIAEGPAQVMLCHDAPPEHDMALGVPPLEWMKAIPAAEAHRELLQEVCMTTRPQHFFHGHYHRPARVFKGTDWGPCWFTALHCDGALGNWGILDPSTMEWEWQPT